MPLFNRPAAIAHSLASHIDLLDRSLGPMQKPLTEERWRDIPFSEVKIMKRTVKMKEDGVVSPDGLRTQKVVAGEEIEVQHETAAGLVRDELAEYVGEEKSFAQRAKDGDLTANELNPDYGTGPHRDAVYADKRSKK